MKYASPGYKSSQPKSNFGSWRVQSSEWSKDGFDELVVRLAQNQSIHLEVMNDNVMWMDVAGCNFWLSKQHGVWFLALLETSDAVLLVDEKATKSASVHGGVNTIRKHAARVKRGLAALRKRQIANEHKFAREAKAKAKALKRSRL